MTFPVEIEDVSMDIDDLKTLGVYDDIASFVREMLVEDTDGMATFYTKKVEDKLYCLLEEKNPLRNQQHTFYGKALDRFLSAFDYYSAADAVQDAVVEELVAELQEKGVYLNDNGSVSDDWQCNIYVDADGQEICPECAEDVRFNLSSSEEHHDDFACCYCGDTGSGK